MEHVTIETEDLAILGEKKPGMLTYVRTGPLESVGDWFDRISLRFGPTVTLGGVMMYCPVSRSALHERIERGGLTVFEFNVTERKTNLLGDLKTVFRKTYAYVPVSELRSWRQEIEERAKARGITWDELSGSDSARVDEIVNMQNREDDESKKSQPAKLEIPLSKYDLEFIENVACQAKYDSAGKFMADVLKPIISGGFSGLSFGKAGLWMMRLMTIHGIGEMPLPKALDKLRRRK